MLEGLSVQNPLELRATVLIELVSTNGNIRGDGIQGFSGLATTQRFDLDIRPVASSTSLIGETIRATDLATISPAHVFAREISFGFSRLRPLVVEAANLSRGAVLDGQIPLCAAIFKQQYFPWEEIWSRFCEPLPVPAF